LTDYHVYRCAYLRQRTSSHSW